MAAGQRPGGLTALAVLNFVFGGLGVMGVLFVAAMFGTIEKGLDEAARESGQTLPPTSMIWVGLLLNLVVVVLLIVSGVGYLGQKRFLGRTMGNAYAFASLALSVFSLTLLHEKFGIGTIIGFVYPALTLLLINGTFKDDLVN